MGNRVVPTFTVTSDLIRFFLSTQKPRNGIPDCRFNRRLVTILMAAYGVSQAEIARLAGVHKSTVTRALQNRRNVTAEKRLAVLLALSRRLKTDVLDLCRGRAAA